MEIYSLPSVLQAKLDLLHDGIKERFHVTTNRFCNVPNGDKCLNKLWSE
jgi:hypothetical protein